MGAFECVGNKISPTDSTEVFTISTSSTVTLNEPRTDAESRNILAGKNESLWWTLFTDIPLFLLFILLVALYELGIIPGHKAGFYCNDPAVSHRYSGDTVSAFVLVSTIFFFPLIAIFAVEYLFPMSEYTGQSKVRQSIKASLYLFRAYIYGLILNLGIVEVMKAIVGYPRPSFIEVCQPETNCVGTEYVYDFVCTKNQFSSWTQMDSYRSFPSGHSSLSVYCGLFIAWLLQRRVFSWSHTTTLLVPMVQLLCLVYCAVCSLTRITDRKHHWWDVLVGILIGIGAVLYIIIITKNFTHDFTKTPSNYNKSEKSQTTVRTLLFEDHRRGTIP